MFTPHSLMLIAQAHAMLGRPIAGLSHLAEAAQIIETTEERLWKPKLHRVRGEVLDATGDRASAEQAYHQSIAVATQQSSRLDELRASTNLARLWRDRGKRNDARDLLAPVYGWFTEGFDTLDLKEAKTLLGRVVIVSGSATKENSGWLENLAYPMQHAPTAAPQSRDMRHASGLMSSHRPARKTQTARVVRRKPDDGPRTGRYLPTSEEV